MFALWPSFGLLVFFLVIFLECRAIAGRVTLPLGSFMMVFCFGAIGAPLLALMFQQIPIFADASANAASPVTWLIGPPIEELAKALPVIVLAFLTRESRRLSIADLTLIGFASGAGFGFVEANLNAIANGALPSVQYMAAFGLQTDSGVVFFAGHPVTTALVGLAAGIGLRFLPPNILYACMPAAFVILWASFDHGIYNWKLLNAADGEALPTAHFVVEFLHKLALRGQLATWVLPTGLIAAQLIEAYRCSKAVGVRRDLLLAREWRPWVANEWLVALLRARLGRAVFAQTLAYFRLRRAFYLAAFETRRDPKNPTLARHARSLEDRLKRERSILFDPAPGTWLLPAVVLRAHLLQSAWRMRWLLLFGVLVLLLFMLDPASLPEGLRQFLFGEIFTIVLVTAGLAFAVWRIIVFGRVPPPDPLAAEGTAFASHYTRQLLLGCSLACGLFPSLAMMLGWKALLPGAAFIGGYLPGWISQGGNLQILLGLGAIGGAVAPDPRPAGEAFRHEIAAGEERIRRLGSQIGGTAPAQLDSFLDAMAKLDAERDAQARRQLALDGCERQASEADIRDPAPVVQAIKDEFDRLAGEVLEAAAKDLDAIASFQQAYSTAWSEIMQDLDAHDRARRQLRPPLQQAWQAQNDIRWALRVVESTDDVLLPMQLTLLPELRDVAATANSARIEVVAAGVERIRTTAAEYGENDPFGFAGTVPAKDDDALLAESAASTPPAEEPKPFGLRTDHPAVAPAAPSDEELAVAKDEQQPASRGQHYQQALDQLIEATRRDNRYLETITELERSDEALRQPIESQTVSTDTRAPHAADSPGVAPSGKHQGELEDLISAIKRDSGYADFAKGARVAPAPEERPKAKLSNKAADDAKTERKDETPNQETAERAAILHEAEPGDQEKAVFAHRPAPVIAIDPPVAPRAALDSEWASAAVAYKQAQEQPSTPSEGDVEPPIPATPQALVEPPEAEAPSAPTEPVHRSQTEAPAVAVEAAKAEIATPAEPEPKQAGTATSDTELGVSPQIEPPTIAVETITAEIAEPTKPETPVEPVQAEPVIEAPAAVVEVAAPAEPQPAHDEAVVTQMERAAHASIEAPSIAVEIATPVESEATQAEPLAVLAEPVQRTEIKAPAATVKTNTTEIAKPTQLEASAKQPQSEALSGREDPSQRAAIEALAARFAPEAKKPEAGETTARTESRASFFARLFEAAMRQSSDLAAKPVERGESEKDETKPSSAQPPTMSAPETQKRDGEPQKPVDEISSPTAEWLADFTTPTTEGTKAQSDDTPLKKIEWPALSQTTQEDKPADTSASPPSMPDGVAGAFEAAAGDKTAQAPSDSAPAAGTKEVAHPVAATPAIEAAKIDAASEARDLCETAQVGPAEPSIDLADAPAREPVQSDDAAKPTLDDASAKVSKPDGADEFASKVDRLSHLLDKLERAMQAAAPAPQQVAPPAKLDQRAAAAQASEPATAVEPEPSAPFQPVEQTPAPGHANESSATPVEKPVVAGPSTVATAQPDVQQALLSEHTPSAETVPAKSAEPQAPSQPEPKPDAPQARADEHASPVEIAPSTAPTDSQASSETQQNSDRLANLLAKFFESVNKDSIKLQPIEARPAPSENAPPPENIAPVHPAESEILDLRGPHLIAEPLDKSTSSEAPLQEQQTAKVEEQPEPVAPPPQVHTAIIEKSAAPVDAATTEPAPDVAIPTAVSEPTLLATASDLSSNTPEQPVQPKASSRSSAPATHFGSRTSQHASTPATVAHAPAKPSKLGHGAVTPTEMSEPALPAAASKPALSAAAPDVSSPASEPREQPAEPKTRSSSSAPEVHFGSRKSPRSPTPEPRVDAEAKPSEPARDAVTPAEPVLPAAVSELALGAGASDASPPAPEQPPPSSPATTQFGKSSRFAAPAPRVDAEAKPSEPSPDAAAPAEPEPALIAAASDASARAPQEPSEQPVEQKIRPPSIPPTTQFGSRKSSRFATMSPTPRRDVEAKPSDQLSSPMGTKEPVDAEKPATTPKRDWKLGSETPRFRDVDTTNKAEPSFRMKTGSGALAAVDTAPVVSPGASTNTPAKYYGPRHVVGGDDEAARHEHAQQHAISLADALTDYYTRAGTPQPAMYTTDRATLHRIIAAGKLDAPRRRGAPWSITGMSRRGEIAIRLKPGAEQYVEFVPSTEIFGQIPHYYPRGVGKGGYHTHVLAEHLEYFDVTARQWAPLRG